MINQLIRKYIKNYTVQLTESSLLSEADKKWEAPYIPAYDTRIGMKVDDAARAAGAITGLPIISTWQLIWLKGKKHGPISISLIKHIEKEKEKIVNEVFSWHENY